MKTNHDRSVATTLGLREKETPMILLPAPPCCLGLVSDTHGLLRPKLLTTLKHVDAILHAGDSDDPEILAELSQIAPVFAVRGNMDLDAQFNKFPRHLRLQCGPFRFCMLHDLARLNENPAGTYDVVISGHTHRAAQTSLDHVLYVNPGAAGPQRSLQPPSCAILNVTPTACNVRIVNLL